MSVDVKIINHSSIKVGVERFNCPDPLPIAYNYPLTGQTTIYATSGGVEGDDAWVEQNVISPRRIAGKAPILVDFFTLHSSTPNKWGNTNRFTDDQGGQDYANKVMQDHGWGVEYYVELAQATWGNSIINSLGTDYTGGTNAQNGKTDWVLGNEEFYNELSNEQIAFGRSFNWSPLVDIEPDFATLGITSFLWSSTTWIRNIGSAKVVQVQNINIVVDKSNTNYYMFMRLIDQ